VPAAARPASLDAVKAAPETGTIVGWVGYDGPAPKPRPINFGADIVCGNMHKEKPALEETLVLNENHTVKWAVVSIRGDVPGEHKIPETPAVLDQVGCIFTPHVVALMAGQEIEYKNSDPVSHNIRGTPKKNQAFNNIYAPNMTSKARFDKAEIGIPIKCDIHFWMASYIHVFPHPFFAVTGDDGAFVLSGLPPGKYTIQLWHEKLRPQTHAVEVAAGEVKELPLTLSAGN
jgi:plastocyanin